jgi:hypothetical protein
MAAKTPLKGFLEGERQSALASLPLNPIKRSSRVFASEE